MLDDNDIFNLECVLVGLHEAEHVMNFKRTVLNLPVPWPPEDCCPATGKPNTKKLPANSKAIT